MTIPAVTGGSTITSTWGNQVGDEVNLQSDRMACNLTHNVAQSLTSGVGSNLSWNQELFDSGGLHDTVTNNSRITIPTGGAGLWLFSFSLEFDTNGTGERYAYMSKNGSATNLMGMARAVPSGAFPCNLNGLTVQRVADADYFQVFAGQSSGGALGVKGSNSAGGIRAFHAVRLGD